MCMIVAPMKEQSTRSWVGRLRVKFPRPTRRVLRTKGTLPIKWRRSGLVSLAVYSPFKSWRISSRDEEGCHSSNYAMPRR